EKRIPAAPVNTFSRALADEQVQHRNMVVDLGHASGRSTKGPGNPIKLSRTNEESFTPAPQLGENTNELMAEIFGYDQARIDELKAAGVVG
ncbi:MAG TPA: acyl-CoA transferase, partial [Spongiibacteraceae bacterium]|nr:acyl-CoA transferase [Spongiibacteraceae bacterium]